MLLVLLPLSTSGCVVRLIADHDEVVTQKTTELQQIAEQLFMALEDAAATPDPTDELYAAHEPAYRDILVLLRVMQVRAATLAKNELTVEQLDLLRDSFERMRTQHRQRSERDPPQGFSAETVAALRQPFVQQVQAILTLQQALRR